jgi:Ca2+-transporting ATPase
MITGDHKQTAAAIAQDLGILNGRKVVSGQELDRTSDDELAQMAPHVGVFARVSPEHKLRIVRALQSTAKVVAMTGDGVNDAPALKQADIGVAMGITGTDVSKEAARMVLANDNFATIVSAIEEGRAVYDNIRKYVLYLLTANVSEMLVISLSILFDLPLALLPIHLLWINLVTDGLPALALGYEPAEPEILKRPPRPRAEGILTRTHVSDIGIFGMLMAVLCFGLYWRSLSQAATPTTAELSYARTVVFLALVLAQLWYVFGLRSTSEPAWRLGLMSNWRLSAAVAVAAALQMAITYAPSLQAVFHTQALSAADLAISVAVSFVPYLALELRKVMRQSLKSGGPKI